MTVVVLAMFDWLRRWSIPKFGVPHLAAGMGYPAACTDADNGEHKCSHSERECGSGVFPLCGVRCQRQ
jgi:hypothetical protein